MATTAELGRRVKARYPGAYDDMDDAELGRSVKAKFPGQYDDFADEPAPVDAGLGDAIARGVGRGGMFRFGDEFVGAARSLGPRGGSGQDFANDAPIVEPVAGETLAERYANARDEERAADRAATEAHPAASFVSELVGGAATGSRLPFPAPRGAGLASRVAAGARGGVPAGAAFGLGGSEAETVGGMGLDAAVGGAGGAAVGAAIPVVGAAVRPVASDLAAWLRTVAGNRNIKAAGGIQSDITRARRQLGPGGANDGRAELQEIGAEMGERGLVSSLSTPAKTFDRSVDLMREAGGRMGQILDAADSAAGVTPGAAGPSLTNILTEATGVAATLARNPNPGAQAASQRLQETIGNYARIVGQGGQRSRLSFRDAHELRQMLDDELYGLRGTKEPWSDQFKAALHDLRGIISREIEGSLDAATASSAAWRQASRDYQVAAKALEFADKGMDRAVGNNFVSPYEMLAALAGAGIGSGHGGAGLTLGGAAAMAGTALARRHGSGVLGAAALRGSNALRSSVSPATQRAGQTATLAELAEFLRSKYGLAPASAVAEEDAP